jgi:hypothetical protein
MDESDDNSAGSLSTLGSRTTVLVSSERFAWLDVSGGLFDQELPAADGRFGVEMDIDSTIQPDVSERSESLSHAAHLRVPGTESHCHVKTFLRSSPDLVALRRVGTAATSSAPAATTVCPRVVPDLVQLVVSLVLPLGVAG